LIAVSGPKADIGSACRDVRFVPKADMSNLSKTAIQSIDAIDEPTSPSRGIAFSVRSLLGEETPFFLDGKPKVVMGSELPGILIVDDNDDNRYTLQLLLESDGHERIASASGGERSLIHPSAQTKVNRPLFHISHL
jgi:hypothetical protein